MDEGLAPQAAMQRAGIWRNRAGLVGRAVARHDGRALRSLARRLALVDRLAKGALPGNAAPMVRNEGAIRAGCDPWAELVDFVVALAGPARRAA